MSYRIYLASKSPRRKAFLNDLGFDFQQVDPDVDESVFSGESATDYVLRVALAKANAGLEMTNNSSALVVAADTTIEIEHQIIGKPSNKDDFLNIFSQLSGQVHMVHSSVVLASADQIESDVTSTKVQFRDIKKEEALAYWNTGEPCDKAAGYAIQGLGAKFVKRIEGSYSGVVGLPLCETLALFDKFKD